MTIPEPTITLDVEATLAQTRRQQAEAAEMQAVSTELQARQWELLAKEEAKGVPNAMQNALQFRKQARLQRKLADKMHELAGTSPEQFRGSAFQAVEAQRFHFQASYITAMDAQRNPDAYGDPSRRPYPVEWAAALAVLEEIEGELQEPQE